MIGGELAKGSIDISDILDKMDYVIDNERTSMLDLSSNPIGKGFQGKIVGLYGDTTKVAKMIKLKNGILNKGIKEIVYMHVYGSDIGVGPQIYGPPFITSDSSHIVFIMDKVSPYVPLPSDNKELIRLFTKSFKRGLVTYDFEYAKDADGKIIFLDFGVCGLYSSYKEAIINANNTDIFLYHDFLRIYFTQKIEKMKKMEKARIGSKKRNIKKSRRKLSVKNR